MIGDEVTPLGISLRWNRLCDKSSDSMPSTFILGNRSVRKLWERSRMKILVRFPKLFGTAPANWFQERSKVSNALNFPRKAGISPLRALWPNSRYCSLGDRKDIEAGIFPEKLLRESMRIYEIG
ncbi:hypothetical protein SLE2022_116600 [Rubroshorea leprosula]